MRLKLALLAGALGLALFALPAAGALSADSTQTYVVQMLPSPVVTYGGGISGLPATKPGKGKKIDPASQDVTKYADYLTGKHDEALSKVGGGQKLYDYVYSLNGFAAKLTEEQAARLGAQKNVLAVSPDELQTIQTSSTPHFLGLDDKGGLWGQLGGVSKGGLSKGAGEDVVIGVIDSGVWPEGQSFSDRKLDGSNGNNYPHKVTGFTGACQTGEQWAASNCNNKLISARYFNAAWGGNAGIDAQRPWEFDSPRDYNGHGSHTSSTAGGNYGVQPTGDAATFSPISGMAPRARIAVYKGLWSTQSGDTASGFTSDLVEAIDSAVADGVDVINYSVGPSAPPPNFLSPEQVAFLNAAAAGVFVSAAAGNTGPTAASTTNPGPWLTTVAAGTHNRASIGSVTLGNGTTIQGASSASAAGPAPFVDAEFAVAAGATTTAARLCFSIGTNGGAPALDPAKVTGKIVLCDRGTNGRTDKSLAVKEAGGIGMVLVNTSPNSLNADIHFVPTVHVADTNRATLKAYATTASPTAKINASETVFNAPAPQIASFSSRGPQVAGAGDLLKPDVTAPGVDVLAAVSPAADHGRLFDLLSGTSMATPHVAGVAALLKQLHPDWSPMAVKSALMTSAYDIVDDHGNPVNNEDPLVIFAEGAGHIKPNSAADPGLVYDSGIGDWIAFLCGTKDISGPPLCSAPPAGFGTIDPSDLNTASIAIGDLAGAQTVTRTVTNVGSKAATYNASVQSPAGVAATVSPSSFTISPGQSKTFTVAFLRTTAALNTYVGGHLTWSDGTHNVRIPMVVQPVKFKAPPEVSGTGATGSLTYETTAGYAGSLTYSISGLQAATRFDHNNLNGDPNCAFNTANPDANVTAGNATVDTFTTPAGANFIRFQTFQADASSSVTDLDLYVYRAPPLPSTAFTLVLASGGPNANEVTNSTSAGSLTPGAQFRVYVHGCSVSPNPGSFSLYAWALTGTPSNPFTAVPPSPQAVAIGQSVPTTFAWAGLPVGNRYLGRVVYFDQAAPTTPMATTTIAVSTR